MNTGRAYWRIGGAWRNRLIGESFERPVSPTCFFCRLLSLQQHHSLKSPVFAGKSRWSAVHSTVSIYWVGQSVIWLVQHPVIAV